MKIIESQQRAINSRESTILLSASAGTGKTHTMVARIVSLLQEGADISSFLVLAFGNDASKEMQSRIEAGIFQLAKADKKYHAQLKKLKVASVSTIHAFAFEIAKTFFAVSGASPKAKILLGADEDVLRATALEKVFLDCYESGDTRFLSLVEYFIQGRKDDALKTIIFDLYTISRNMPSGEFKNKFFNSFETCQLENIYLDIAKAKAKSLLENYLEKTEIHEIYAEHYNQASVMLKAVINSSSLSELQDIASLPMKAKTRKNKNHPENFAAINDNFHELIRNRVRDFFNLTRKELDCLLETEEFKSEYIKIASDLFWLCEKFEQEYSSLKSKKDFVDFSDTEHMLLKVLQDEKSREELQGRYKHIFCDEYQDVSKIQEEILSLLSQKGNLFVVGDIKQSIFGFRACDQTVIKDREKSILATGEGLLLPMNTNFRSHSDVLEFCNSVFSVALQNPDICVYEENSMFDAMAEFPDLGGVEIAVAKKPSKPALPREDVYSVIADKGSAKEEVSAIAEGAHIAKFIRGYLGKQFEFQTGTRDIRLSDFAILLRNTSGKFAPTIAKVLEQNNLPSFIVASETNLENHPKMLFLLDFLKVIASPFEDISLYSTLVSPFFEISDNTLLQIRKENDGKYFHECFFALARKISTKYSLPLHPFSKENFATATNPDIANQIQQINEALEIQDMPKPQQKAAAELDVFSFDFSSVLQKPDASQCEIAVARFLTAHQKYRTLALVSAADMLKTAMLENSIEEKILLAFGDGELQFAKEFLRFISALSDSSLAAVCEKIEKAFSTIKLAGGTSTTNAIAIMTMHKSKGLEFPFTIIAGTGRNYNTLYTKDTLLLHKDYGMAFAKRDLSMRKRTDLMQKIALKKVVGRDNKNEELRLLYVALTRAKYKLLITGTLDDDFYIQDNLLVSGKIQPFSCQEDFYSYTNHLSVILAALAKSKYACNYTLSRIESENAEIENAKIAFSPDSEVAKVFADKLSGIENSNVDFPIIPTKFTATQRLESFSKRVAEENLQALEKYEVTKIIDFATKNRDETAPQDGEIEYSKTAIGTAYHKILEEIPFFLSVAEIEKFTAAMIERGEILDMEYNNQKIFKLTNNPLFQGATPYREVPFVMELDSEKFDLQGGTKVLCQGVIDCILQKENGDIIILDYKATSIKNHQKLREKYYRQLETYKIACEKILNARVEKCFIYSIFQEELIEV